MSDYQLTPEAQADLDAIGDYILEQSGVNAALGVLADIRDACRRDAGNRALPDRPSR